MVYPTPNDIRIYEDEILPWLPEEIIDCHAHVGMAEFCGPISPERKKALWAIEVATELRWESLREVLAKILPDRQISVLAFGFPYREIDIERNNRYAQEGSTNPINRAASLLITKPEWSPELIEKGLDTGFVGIKPYPDLAPNGAECSIYDFLPKEHLRVLNEAGGILVLHLPRAGRLADPNNIREILEISDQFPTVKLIIAHIGRSFCLPTAQAGLPAFADHPGIFFDTSANLNSEVFRSALETIGPDRILFGSDLPITLMRGIREHVGDKYFNFTNGDYSWNKDRKPAEVESGYTFYLYEELRAIIGAVRESGMGLPEMQKIMYSNCKRLLPQPEQK